MWILLDRADADRNLNALEFFYVSTVSISKSVV